jgi:hypothetical protein
VNQEVERGKKSVDDGVEILMAPGRQINQADAPIGELGITLAAIHRDWMSARG